MVWMATRSSRGLSPWNRIRRKCISRRLLWLGQSRGCGPVKPTPPTRPRPRSPVRCSPANATAKGGLRGWDALTHLCFSKYLRIDRARTDGFVRAATALLDAGASANTGFFAENHQPKPEWESVLYGAAGVAHHPEMTRLLLERGADPNDEEVPYHAPETLDNRALKILVESGKLTPVSIVTMLLRKFDWHDDDGVAWLLDHGADPNLLTHWGGRPPHPALSPGTPLTDFVP